MANTKKRDKQPIGCLKDILLLLLLVFIIIAITKIESCLGLPSWCSSCDSEPKPINHSIGETENFHSLELTVNNFEFSQYAGAIKELSKADDEYIYLNVYVSAKNTGNSNLSPKDYTYHIIYDGEYRYSSHFYLRSEFLGAYDSIIPLGTLTDKVLCFKVPKEIMNSDKSITLSLKLNKRSEKEEVIWTLR